MKNLEAISDAILEKLDNHIVQSYDRLRQKTTITRDIDLICDRKNHSAVKKNIVEALMGDFFLYNEIDNYYSLQLYFQDKNGKRIQIDLMDGVYWKHWQITSANELLLNQRGENINVKLVKYAQSRIYQLRRMIKVPGRKIVFIGSDGAGKTSVISEIEHYYKQNNIKYKYKYLFPGFFKRYQTKPESSINQNPHALASFSFLSEEFHKMAWLLEFTLGQLIDWFARYQGYNVIYDRYIFDMFLDPKRYRIKRSNILRYYPLIFDASSLIYLYGNPDKLYARKPETSLRAILEFQAQADHFYASYRHKKKKLNSTECGVAEILSELIRNNVI